MIYRHLYNTPVFRFRSPFSELDQIRRQMARFTENFLGNTHHEKGCGVFPSVNITETRNGYVLRSELPGVSPSDMKVEATQKTLSISGERKRPEVIEGAKFHRKERETGTFSRMITFEEEIKPEGIEAQMKNGLLTIRIPKAEKLIPKQIKIQ